jgi:hypothetical protein
MSLMNSFFDTDKWTKLQYLHPAMYRLILSLGVRNKDTEKLNMNGERDGKERGNRMITKTCFNRNMVFVITARNI